MAVFPGVLGSRTLRRSDESASGPSPAVPRDGCPPRHDHVHDRAMASRPECGLERVMRWEPRCARMLYNIAYCDKSIILMSFLSWYMLRNQASGDLLDLGHLRRSGQGRVSRPLGEV